MPQIFRKQRFIFGLVSVLFFSLMLTFQNCSDVSFKDVSGTNNKVGDPGGGGLGVTPPSDIVCKENEVIQDGVCVPGTTLFTECKEFRELDTNIIPSLQDGQGICYYKKVLDALARRPSERDNSKRVSDVLARDHNNYSNLTPIGPFVLGDNTQVLKFLASRSLSLTSSPVAEAEDIQKYPIKIDNFFLVEVTDNTLPKRMLARGTADARPFLDNDNKKIGKILVKNAISDLWETVDNFISYAAGGTAVVPVLSLKDQFDITLNEFSTFRFRMLDCGGSAEATDMYLIIH